MSTRNQFESRIDSILAMLGGQRISFKAGQVLHYMDQYPRGYYLLIRGRVALSDSELEGSARELEAVTAPQSFPDFGDLDQPLPYTLLTRTASLFWFFPRFVCQPGSFVLLCLDGLNEPGNPLFKLWSSYVATT